MNQKKIENKFYAAAPGKKARFATMNEVEQRYRMLLRRVQNGENEQGGIQWLGDIKDAIQNKNESPEVLMAEIKDVERRMGFAASGAKAKMARNADDDTDDVKNILHKETSDAEWGIDRETVAHRTYMFFAYHGWRGERVSSKRFNTRGEAERWLEKQNAAGHPNKRKHARPGTKAKMANAAAWTNSDDREADRVIQAMKELDGKCSKKRAEIFDIESNIIPRVIAMANAAKQKKDTNFLAKASHAASQADNVRYSFSRPGAKAKFAVDRRKILNELNDLLDMLKEAKANRSDISEVESAIDFVFQTNNKNDEIGQVYRNTMRIGWRYFSRPGAKAKFAWQPEINKKIRENNEAIDNLQARLRQTVKQGSWLTASAYCRSIAALYSNSGLAGYYEDLQEAAFKDKERRSK